MSFDDFWAHYPLKKGKGYARKCYERARKNGMPSDGVLIKAIDEQSKEKAFLKSQNKFCPEWKNPSTWLNQECWADACILPMNQTPKPPKSHPIQTLHRAYNILLNLGQEKFKSYCLQIGLSREDQLAIWCKFNGTHDVNKLTSNMLKSI